MNMGVRGSGDRARLTTELRRLKRLGLKNLRVTASSEGPNGEPYRMTPALMTSPGVYDRRVLDGLDFLLAQVRANGMRALLVLNNFWQWPGGMAQYVSWARKTPIPYPIPPEKWPTFISYSAGFYGCSQCQHWYREHIRTLVERVNTYTGLSYRDDPSIFS